MTISGRQKALGVTVAVGSPYEDLAPIAAACFYQQTGIETVVLGSTEYAASGLPHPAALRLLAFDHVTADRIVYFDADWLCLRQWSPLISPAEEARACRDFILEDEFPRQVYQFKSAAFLDEPNDALCRDDMALRYEYLHEVKEFAGITLPYTSWINTGLLVVHRDYHARWFRKALDLYLDTVGHHDMYFEQPALVKALEFLDLRVRLLPRRFNVLAAFEAKWPSSVVGLHVKLKRHDAFLEQMRLGAIRTPDDVTAYFTLPADEALICKR